MALKSGIYIVTGIMASGKSTIGELLANQFEKGVHIRGDVFRRMIVSGRVEMEPNHSQTALEQLLLRYKLAAQTAETYYKAGYTVVVQDNYLGKEANSFINMFKSRPLYLITLCPNSEAVLKRENERSKKGYGDWDVDSLNNVLLNENPRIGLWLDSSNMTPEETLSEIRKRAEIEALIS